MGIWLTELLTDLLGQTSSDCIGHPMKSDKKSDPKSSLAIPSL
jgi:hypothetical protein